jgi:cyclophilin family peptidyl-prolyl cis-trans isomerase
MASKHRAATSVTIAPLEERNVFEGWVSKYWLHALIVAGLLTAAILYRQYSANQAQAARDGSWDRFAQATTTPPFPRIPTAPPAELAQLADELNGTAAGPWARLLEATTLLGERRFEEATAATQRLSQDYPEHALVKDLYAFAEDEAPRTVVQQLLETIDAQQRWEAEQTALFQNPAPADDAQRVRIKTDRGDVVVALYAGQASLHAQNFLARCSSGYYDATKFHRVDANFMIQGGDPNTKEGDPTTWGQGGPDETIPFEENDLYHFEAVLSAAKLPGATESSGSQFFITVEPAHHLDGQHVVFGAVVDGMDVVRTIAQGAIEEGTADRPVEPVVVLGTEVL